MTDRKPQELSHLELRWKCELRDLDFKTTDTVPPLNDIVGQENAIRALEYGLNLDIGANPNANIFVMGLNGTGRATVVKRKLEDLARQADSLPDRVFGWAYAHNFDNSETPTAIRFHNKGAGAFQKTVDDILTQVKEKVRTFPELFEARRKAMAQVERDKFKEALGTLSTEAEKEGFKVNFQVAQTGPQVEVVLLDKDNPETVRARIFLTHVTQVHQVALDILDANGKAFPLDAIAQHITDEDLQKAHVWHEKVMELFSKSHQAIEGSSAKIREELITTIPEPVRQLLEEWKSRKDVSESDLPSHNRILTFLEGLCEYTEKNFSKFEQYAQALAKAEQHNQDSADMLGFLPTDPYLPFSVNVLYEPEDSSKIPVVIEPNPKYSNLFGSVAARFFMGRHISDPTMIHGGSLHEANGGFIIIDALSLLQNWVSWDALKRTIKTRHITIGNRLEELDFVRYEGEVKPESIPFRCKVVLLGNTHLYHLLMELDPDFKELFEISVPFDFEMPLNEEAIDAYAAFVSMVQHQKQLRPFAKDAVARIVEEGVRLTPSTTKISTQFGTIQKIIVEANHIAGRENSKTVERKHVLAALKAQEERSFGHLIENKMFEHMLEGAKLIDTEGAVEGQINGLAVYQLPDGYSFGTPLRITAQTFVGKYGVINIEREADLSGSSLDKSFLIIQGHLGGTYGQKQLLAVTASVAFEQSYSGSDGDSASLAGILPILSGLSKIPVKQNYAITGSMNQKGEVQPIGGVNEKAEGWFRLCKERGLKKGDKSHGIVIPVQNVKDLMLSEEVVEAVKNGLFHVITVSHIDEAIKVMMDTEAGERSENGEYPAESVHGKVCATLKSFADIVKPAQSDQSEQGS